MKLQQSRCRSTVAAAANTRRCVAAEHQARQTSHREISTPHAVSDFDILIHNPTASDFYAKFQNLRIIKLKIIGLFFCRFANFSFFLSLCYKMISNFMCLTVGFHKIVVFQGMMCIYE